MTNIHPLIDEYQQNLQTDYTKLLKTSLKNILIDYYGIKKAEALYPIFKARKIHSVQDAISHTWKELFDLRLNKYVLSELQNALNANYLSFKLPKETSLEQTLVRCCKNSAFDQLLSADVQKIGFSENLCKSLQFASCKTLSDIIENSQFLFGSDTINTINLGLAPLHTTTNPPHSDLNDHLAKYKQNLEDLYAKNLTSPLSQQPEQEPQSE